MTDSRPPAVNDDLRDMLVAISKAVADQDDRAAQAMLREILKAPQPSPTAQAAPAAVAGPVVNRATVIEWLDANDIEVTDRQLGGLFHFSAPPTAQAEQQATKETSGGFHVWRDISTAPKDGSRFVATGHNYGLYSEGWHACVAQWFRGSWIGTSDWNETSELTHLTHWMPLPPPPTSAEGVEHG